MDVYELYISPMKFMINMSNIFLIHHSVKLSENSETLQIQTTQDDIFKLLTFHDQQTKNQRYSVYNDIKQRKVVHAVEVEVANVQHVPW